MVHVRFSLSNKVSVLRLREVRKAERERCGDRLTAHNRIVLRVVLGASAGAVVSRRPWQTAQRAQGADGDDSGRPQVRARGAGRAQKRQQGVAAAAVARGDFAGAAEGGACATRGTFWLG